MPAPLLAQTVEVRREEYGAVEVQSVLTVEPSSHRMTVECVAFNLVGVSKDTFAMEVSSKSQSTVTHGYPQAYCLILSSYSFFLCHHSQVHERYMNCLFFCLFRFTIAVTLAAATLPWFHINP